jgi:hypothetical protein
MISGAFLPSLSIEIYSQNFLNIAQGNSSINCTPRVAYSFVISRYPTHSLLRLLLVSNSLDLILDVLLELWSAVIGIYSLFKNRVFVQHSNFRLYSTLRFATNSSGPFDRYSGRYEYCIFLDYYYLHRPHFIRPGRPFSGLV